MKEHNKKCCISRGFDVTICVHDSVPKFRFQSRFDEQ